MKTRHYKTLKGLMRATGIRYLTLRQFRDGRIIHKSLGFIRFTLDDSAKLEFIEGITGVIWSKVTDERLSQVANAGSYGIFDRLWYNGKRYEYCAGQDYTGEIRTIQYLMRKG
jgi:hypothetical protein